MSAELANPSETQHESGARQRLKCSYCRRDKQKCDPVRRQWPGQKCTRCERKERPCGPNEKAGSRSRKPRRRRQPANPLMTSFSASESTNIDTSSQPRITLDTTYDGAEEAADSRDGHFAEFGTPLPMSLLQPPAATPAQSGSSITELEDESSVEDLYKLRLFIEFVLHRARALLPPNVTQHDVPQTLSVSNDLRRMAESAESELSTRCTQLIKRVEDDEDAEEEDKRTAVQQYQDLLVCMECDHTKKRNDVLAEPWKRVLRKIIKAKLTNGNYFEACVRKIKVNGLLMIPTPCRSQRRLNEWCRCVLECSEQLTAVNDNLKMTSGSPYPATNPVPALHLALMLQLEHNVLSKLLSMKIDAWNERDLINRNVLHVAAECSNSMAIQYILNHLNDMPNEVAALLQQRDVVGRTPVLVAAHLGNVHCVRLLAATGANLADLDFGSLGVLELACAAGNKDIAEYLLCQREGFSADGRIGLYAPNPLHNAAKGNFREVCMFLLQWGANVGMRDPSGKTAAELAYDRGYYDLAADLSRWAGSSVSGSQLAHPDWPDQLDMETTTYPHHSF